MSVFAGDAGEGALPARGVLGSRTHSPIVTPTWDFVPMPWHVDGVGTMARFSSPRGMCFTPERDLLVADWGNSAIRQIVVDGSDKALVQMQLVLNYFPPGLLPLIATFLPASGSVTTLFHNLRQPKAVAIKSTGEIVILGRCSIDIISRHGLQKLPSRFN